MNYGLAKQLMDAGFPQGGKGSWAHPTNVLVMRSGDRMYVPTLEELIEVVEEDIRCEMFLLRFDKGKWTAQIVNASTLISSEECDTAIEAVARLWLGLDKRR